MTHHSRLRAPQIALSLLGGTLFIGVALFFTFRHVERNPAVTLREEQAHNIEDLVSQLKASPHEPKVALKLAKLYHEYGDFDAELTLLLESIEANPTNQPLILQLAHLYRYRGRFEESEQMFQRAIVLKPNDAWAYIDLAKLYRNWNKYEKGEELLAKAITIDPTNDRIYSYGLGYIYRDEGDFKKALPFFEKAFALNPDWFNHKALGDIYRDLERYNEAEALFKKSVELNAQSEAYQSLGWLYLDTNRVDDAIKAFEDFLRFIRPKSDVYIGLGSAYLRKNDFAHARENYELAVKLNPRGGGYEGLGSVAVREHKWGEAMQAYETELSFDPSNERIINILKELREKERPSP